MSKGIKYTLENLETINQQNIDIIKQANKGLPCPVKILGWYILTKRSTSLIANFTLLITEYIDGNGAAIDHKTIL